MPFTIKNSIIRSVDGRIKFKIFHPGGKEHYHLGVWVASADRDLDTVERVQYTLDPSFKNPVRESSNRRNNFSITFWTWGLFTVEVKLFHANGRITQLTHQLSFDLPEDDGSNYVEV